MQAVFRGRSGPRSPPHARRVIFLAAATLLLTPVMSLEGQEECDEDLVHPPDARVHGRTMGEWAAVWWTWIVSIPRDENPMLDTTGMHCAVGQGSEKVFFLAATLGGRAGEVRRACRVPAGKEIFIPLFPLLAWSPGDCERSMMDGCRGILAGFVAQVRSRSCSVDERPLRCLEDHRHISPEFDFNVPLDNILGLDPAITYRGVADGDWLMLKPLSPGEHTISFQMTVEGFPIELIIYDLIVEGGEAAAFRRGDSDGNGAVNVTDAVVALSFLFAGADPLPCLDAADADDDGRLSITDAVSTLLWLFQGGTVPPAPGPVDCGADPTEDSLDCRKGC